MQVSKFYLQKQHADAKTMAKLQFSSAYSYYLTEYCDFNY